MIKDDLYELERDVYKNVDRIKREQSEYLKGFENGISMMFEAVRAFLAKEAETASNIKEEIRDCSNCRYGKDGNKVPCRSCIQSCDPYTKKTTTPSMWQPEREDTNEEG